MTFFSSATHSTLFSDNVLALCINALTTAALCATGWCESKDTYWLVCVAFLNTEVVRDPLSSLCRHTSRNGSFPSVSSSTVNWMHSSMLFRWLRNCCSRSQGGLCVCKKESLVMNSSVTIVCPAKPLHPIWCLSGMVSLARPVLYHGNTCDVWKLLII